MPEVNDILELLENGRWHNLEEIRKKIQLQDIDITGVTKFLAKYDLIKVDKEGKKAKLDSSTQHFLKKIRRLEGQENP